MWAPQPNLGAKHAVIADGVAPLCSDQTAELLHRPHQRGTHLFHLLAAVVSRLSSPTLLSGSACALSSSRTARRLLLLCRVMA